ncbi:ABC transporter substrate-binding protein [Bacillus sp. AK128]
MNKAFILPYLMIIILASLLSGCKEQTKTAPEPNESEKETTISIQHAAGTTEVPSNPKRIVVLTNEATEALLKLGMKPVGAVNSWVGQPWYDYLSSDMGGIEPVGFEHDPTIESIKALQPDLIIGNKMRHEQIYDELSEIAPTVYSETLHSDWKTNFTFYSRVVNQTEEGQQVLADWQTKLEDFAKKAGEQLQVELSVIRFMTDHVRIYHMESFAASIIEEIGLHRPEAQAIPDVAEMIYTTQQMNAIDGDVLFYSTYDTEENLAENLESEWINDSSFQSLEVMQSGKVIKVDDSIWHRSGGVLAAELLLRDLEEALFE